MSQTLIALLQAGARASGGGPALIERRGEVHLAVEFAAAALGAAVLGINTRYGVFELSHLMATARPTAIVLPARFLDLDFKGRLSQAYADARQAQPELRARARRAEALF